MRLTYLVTRGDSIGGAQIHVRDLATAFSQHHEVTVAMGSDGPLRSQLEGSGVATRILPGLVRNASPKADLAAVGAVRRLLRELQPDLVSTHSSKAGTIGRLAAFREGIPCIFTAHGWSFTDGVALRRRGAYLAIEAAAAALGPHIICVSHHDEALVSRIPWMRSRCTTIHNGVHDIPATLLATPGTGPLRAVMTGRLDHQKDHETLFRAVAAVDGLVVDLIGDGLKRDALADLASHLGVANRVRFLGQIDDVAEHLANASLFVLASRWEGLPRSILEAMRAGLPVVASSVGGVPELIDDGRTGALVARGDVEGLASALRRYASSAALRIAHGAAARACYEEHFTFERLVAETWAFYDVVTRPG